MTLLLALASLSPVLGGYVLAGWLPAPPGSPRPSPLLRACLAPGWAVGASSCLFFAWLVLVGPPGPAFRALETALFLGLAAVAAFAPRKRGASGATLGRPARLPGFVTGLLSAALVIAVGLGIASFVLLTLENPHGDWDAIAIWNLRARFLYRAGGSWTDAFDPGLITSHLDYPLLVPTSVVRGWVYLGRESTTAPALVAFAFALAGVGLVVSALASLRGRTQGLLGGLVVLSAPLLFEWGSIQCADVPLAYYYLATVVALAMADRAPEGSSRWAMLAGMMAGFAAWTKNEGLLFLAVVLAVRFASVAPSLGWRAYRAGAVPFALGLAPALIVVAWFKVRLAPPNDLLGHQGLDSLMNKLSDPSRYVTVGRAMLGEIAGLGSGAIVWLAAYGLLLGAKPGLRREPGSRFATLVPVLLLAGDFLVYIVTPLHLPWHLQWSLSRLILHLWPLSVFAFFLSVATPDEALARSS